MVQSSHSGKTSVLGVIIATVCIIVYIGALVTVIVRFVGSIEQRRFDAEQEFYDLADLISSATAATFMEEDFVNIIRKAFNETRTLEGVIITGPVEDYYFEKEPDRAIYKVNGSPRFKSRFDFSRQPLYLPLQIPGLRNVNVQAVAGAFNYPELARILKQTMILVASALALAFLTLLMESMAKKRDAPAPGLKSRGQKAAPESRPDSSAEAAGTPEAAQVPPVGERYSRRSRVVREENTEFRLTEELQRCAASGHDLAFIVMEFKPPAGDEFYARLAADAARFFSSRDFVCEKGERGISVICPGLNLDTGFLNADEFHNRAIGKYPGIFKSKTDFCMGLAARTGRPVNAERLIFEADEALERAMMDPVSHIVAFKSDPEKYRAFMEGRGQAN